MIKNVHRFHLLCVSHITLSIHPSYLREYYRDNTLLLTGLERDFADKYPSSRKIETYLDIPSHHVLQIDGYVYSSVLNGLRLCAQLYRRSLPFFPV